ncbi:MAG: GNAT family N-acetyltransferase [Sedimenticola sp.]
MANGWRIVNAIEQFHRYRDNWQRLAIDVLGCDHPLAHVDYVEPLLNHLGDENVLLALYGVNGEDGMVLLEKRQPGGWSTFAPHTGPFTFGLIRNDDSGYADQAIGELIKTLPGLAMMLSFLKLDPAHPVAISSQPPERTQRLDYFETLQIPTDRSFEDYWSERSRNLRRNITKKTNRLNDHNISYELNTISSPDQLAEAVRTYGEIEQHGWKGKAGTAVDFSQASGRFYVDMLGRFAEREKATAYQLVFDGVVVASALTIKGCGMLIILKITFNEDKSDYSPGLLMMYELHKLAFEDPEVEIIEYYGKATQRAQQWAVNLRTLYHLNYFRSPLAYKAVDVLRKARCMMAGSTET